MPLRHPPKPNTQALSWFYGEHKKGALILDPKYQRNPIWSIGQKCFLIDSIVSGAPLPQVYINIRMKKKGADRITIYEVVDGQQRLRAILEFMTDTWPLIATTARSYPVSESYKPHIGKKYSELPSEYQDAIWNYPLAVQELRDWDDLQIRDLFRRLNYVVEKLNKQELRHSQYFGEFVETVEKLANDPFWDEIAFFSRRESQRMKDIELVSELFVIVLDGIQNQQKTLDRFYADYDVVFPKKSSYVARFNHTIVSLRSLFPGLTGSRFTKKADFYALFAAAVQLNASSKTALDLTRATKHLLDLSYALETAPEDLRGTAARYYATVIEGPNKLPKREARATILRELISKAIG